MIQHFTNIIVIQTKCHPVVICDEAASVSESMSIGLTHSGDMASADCSMLLNTAVGSSAAAGVTIGAAGSEAASVAGTVSGALLLVGSASVSAALVMAITSSSSSRPLPSSDSYF